MKTVFALLLTVVSLNVFAADISSVMDGAGEEFCPDYVIAKQAQTVHCKVSNANEVIQAKTGKELTDKELATLGFEILSPVDIGFVPDADSSIAFSYTRWLVNPAGKKVGVLVIDGWHNDEMRDSARFYVRYNLKGKAVSVSIEDGLRN